MCLKTILFTKSQNIERLVFWLGESRSEPNNSPGHLNLESWWRISYFWSYLHFQQSLKWKWPKRKLFWFCQNINSNLIMWHTVLWHTLLSNFRREDYLIGSTQKIPRYHNFVSIKRICGSKIGIHPWCWYVQATLKWFSLLTNLY